VFDFLEDMFLALRFIIQFMTHGLSITGAVAASIEVLQILLGIYGSKVKKKGKYWLIIHRTIAAMLLIAILIHIE
jgi:hypothetical protein